MYLTATIIAPDDTREVTAADLPDYDLVVTDAIDRFAAYAADPVTEPGATWYIIQTVHVGHDDTSAFCSGDCVTRAWLTLGPVGEVRQAMAALDAYFALVAT